MPGGEGPTGAAAAVHAAALVKHKVGAAEEAAAGEGLQVALDAAWGAVSGASLNTNGRINKGKREALDQTGPGGPRDQSGSPAAVSGCSAHSVPAVLLALPPRPAAPLSCTTSWKLGPSDMR
jgi:hypothetical protein